MTVATYRRLLAGGGGRRPVRPAPQRRGRRRSGSSRAGPACSRSWRASRPAHGRTSASWPRSTRGPSCWPGPRGVLASSAALRREALAQTWDWHPDLAAATVTWTVQQPGGRWFTTATEAGILAKLGCTSTGLACGLNFLASLRGRRRRRRADPRAAAARPRALRPRRRGARGAVRRAHVGAPSCITLAGGGAAAVRGRALAGRRRARRARTRTGGSCTRTTSSPAPIGGTDTLAADAARHVRAP